MKIFEGLEALGFEKVPDVDLFSAPKNQYTGKRPNEISNELAPEDYFYKKTFECPVCDKEFQDTVIKKGKLRYISSDTDLRAIYQPFDPMYYDIIMCNKCGYASMSSTFNKISDKQAERITENISSKFKQREYPLVITTELAIERYKFSLLNAMVKGGKNGEKAYLCLKIAWLYRDIHDNERELFFLQNAFVGLKDAYSKENFPICGIDESSLTYILADLARKCGLFDEALRWIGHVIMSKNVNSRLKDRALDMKETLKIDMGKTK